MSGILCIPQSSFLMGTLGHGQELSDRISGGVDFTKDSYILNVLHHNESLFYSELSYSWKRVVPPRPTPIVTADIVF